MRRSSATNWTILVGLQWQVRLTTTETFFRRQDGRVGTIPGDPVLNENDCFNITDTGQKNSQVRFPAVLSKFINPRFYGSIV